MKTASFWLPVTPARASVWIVATLLVAPFLGCAGGGGNGIGSGNLFPPATPTPTGQAHKEQLKTPANTPPPITYNGSYPMPEPFDPNEYLSGIQMGSDGNMWASEYDGDAIAQFTPTGVATAFPIPTASSGPADMTLAPDGNIWFSESLSNKIANISPAGLITEYPLDPTVFPINPAIGEGPRGIAIGPDGNVWFNHTSASKIGRMTLAGVLINSYAYTSGGLGGRITTGPDGNMWFTEASTSKIGRINVASGQITEFPTPTANSYPHTIVQAADGNLWFTERDASQVASITTTGFITEYTTPTKIARPLYMTTTPDGSLWFAEYWNNAICRVDPRALTMVEYTSQVPGGVFVRGITPGPSSTIWTTDDAHDAVIDFGAPGSATPGYLRVHKRSRGRIQ
jgi:streptogramin lyase